MSKKKPLSVTRYQIKSTGVSPSILPEGSRVWVKMGKQMLQKRVEHLVPGDKVLSVNTGITLSLEQIKQALYDEDSEYKKSNDALYVNIGNKRKTRLQVFLEGIHGFDSDELKESDKTRAIRIIGRRLTEAQVKATGRYGDQAKHLTRSSGGIRNWLEGTTTLPDDLYTLRVLRKLGRTRFDELFGKPKDLQKGEGSHLVWAHKFWEKNHTTLTSWVSRFSKGINGEFELITEEQAKEKDEKEAKSGKERESLAKQRNMIYGRLIRPVYEEVDKQHAFVRVETVEPIDTVASKPKPKGETLSRGIISSENLDSNLPGLVRVDYNDLRRQNVIVGFILTKILGGTYFIPSKTNAGELVVGQTLKNLITHNKRLDEETREIAIADKILTVDPSEVNKTLENIEREIVNGKLDEQHGLEQGTIVKLLDFLRHEEERNPAAEHFDVVNLAGDPNYVRERRRIGGMNWNRFTTQLKKANELLDYYGISPISPIIPEIYGTKTEKEVQTEIERIKISLQKEKFTRYNGINTLKIPEKLLPPSPEEVRRALEAADISQTEWTKLTNIYGLHNFIEKE